MLEPISPVFPVPGVWAKYRKSRDFVLEFPLAEREMCIMTQDKVKSRGTPFAHLQLGVPQLVAQRRGRLSCSSVSSLLSP